MPIAVIIGLVVAVLVFGYVWVDVSYRRDRARLRQALEAHDHHFHETFTAFFGEDNPLLLAYRIAETEEEREQIRAQLQQQIDTLVGRMW